jgi:HK97 family phage prohead protease
MQHLTLDTKASTITDLGEFSAIAATWSVDRDGEQIVRGAFARTITKWQASGKRLPLHWNHSGEAANVIGAVDASSMRETGDGLYIEGKLDLERSEVAREAWRSMRNDAVSLSFGFLAQKQRDRADGVRELVELDLYEVSIVPAPSNADTKFLELKAVTALSSVPDLGLSDVLRYDSRALDAKSLDPIG